MNAQTDRVDHELIQAAAHVADTRCRGDNHTVAAARCTTTQHKLTPGDYSANVA